MTNQELLNRSQALNNAAERVQTTRLRYAVQKNIRHVQQALKPYQETLNQLAEEHGVEMQGELNGTPEAFDEALEDLLSEDAGEVDIHTVPPETLDREDEKGTELDMQTISALDWMIE